MKSLQKKLGINIIFLLCVLVTLSVSGYADEVRPKIIFGDDIYYPPYSYMDENGQPAGYNIELAKAIAGAMGYDYEIRLDEWHEIRKMLESGEIHVISGMFNSEDREPYYDFSTPHSAMTGDLFTKQSVYVESLSEIEGERVAVMKDDIVSEYLMSSGLEFELVEVATVADALRLLSIGEVSYAGLLKAPALYAMEDLGYQNLKAQDLGLLASDYAMAVIQGDESTLNLVNGGLQLIKATGEYDIIRSEWLGVYEERGIVFFYRKYKWVIFSIIGLIVLLLINNLFMRLIVNRKTKALKELNQSLIESENRNRAIVTALPDIVFTMNHEGVFLDIENSESNELYFPKEIVIGSKVHAFMPDKIVKQCMHAIELALESGSVQTFEYEYEFKGKIDFYEMRVVKSRKDRVIAIARNITSDKVRRDYVEFLSYHDPLTDLYNRRFFVEELKRLDVERNYPLCIVMADVNGLKLVNDAFGHTLGDELLVKVAETLKEACREDEIISRIGGDEFVILIPNMPNEHAKMLIDRIQEIASKIKVNGIDLSVSFGWEVKKHPDQDIDEVFNDAEDMMYARKLIESPAMRERTIKTIVKAVQAKSDIEKKHMENVTKLCKAFAKSLDMGDREIEEMKTIAQLHDIGKIAVKEAILNKDGPLTEEEFAEVKKHSEVGYRILSSVNEYAEEAEVVLHHHERYDGTGYPMGLSGEAIPLKSRILAIVDSYEAMTSDRPYRKRMSIEEAKEEIKAQSGKQFDPRLASWFVSKIIPYF